MACVYKTGLNHLHIIQFNTCDYSVNIMATKRKHSSKPMHEKYQALLEVESGGKKDIAEKYGVPLNTLSTWLFKVVTRTLLGKD